jgi:uncharacterized protein
VEETVKGVLDPKARAALLRKVKGQFRLDLAGEHGAPHWMRVRENGLRLCAQIPEADKLVVELFAIVHDSQRENDGLDPMHGQRAGFWVADNLTWFFDHFTLDGIQLAALVAACTLHSQGMLRAAGLPRFARTVEVCWDADRLDLGRVGIVPDPERLCTDAARDLIKWAYNRSIK